MSLFPWTDYKGSDEMENRGAYVIIFYFSLYFSFEMGSSLQALRHTKRLDIYIYLPNQPPKTF